jgi:hypothetical protein
MIDNHPLISSTAYECLTWLHCTLNKVGFARTSLSRNGGNAELHFHFDTSDERPRGPATARRGGGAAAREGEDTKQWALTLLEFSDSSELANLETLLVQLAPSKCYVSAELEQTQQVGASPRFRTYRLTRQTDPLASAKC